MKPSAFAPRVPACASLLALLVATLLAAGCQTPPGSAGAPPLIGVPVRIVIIDPLDISTGEEALVVIVLDQPSALGGQTVELAYSDPGCLEPSPPAQFTVHGQCGCFKVKASSQVGTVTISAQAVDTEVVADATLNVN